MNAYTYYLHWTEKNIGYYGVRYARDCDPSDLWETYFTSSKHVERYVIRHGNPDVISIRKTFGEDTDSAREWEKKVITRCRMVERKEFLNHTNNMGPPINNNWGTMEPILLAERKKAASERAKKQHAEGRFNGYEKPDDTTNYKNAANKRWSDPSFKKKMKSKRWMNLNEKSKMISPEDLESYLSMGWSFGRGG